MLPPDPVCQHVHGRVLLASQVAEADAKLFGDLLGAELLHVAV